MPIKAAKKSKRDALKRHGTLNPHPNAVTDPLFQTGDFFDRNDLVQVKYEMLRRVTVDKQSVTQSATAFGFSRPTYYQAEADFQRDGLFGLLPEKRGPRKGHKLTSEVLDFATQLRTSDPSLCPLDLAAAIQERFAINAHPRSIERALRRQKKNVAESGAGARKTAEPETLTSAYEDLRRQAAEYSRSGGLGMAIFLDQGMLACSWVASTNPDNSRRCPTTAPPLSNELRGEIALVLAAMALKQAPEVYP
jgi:transposase